MTKWKRNSRYFFDAAVAYADITNTEVLDAYNIIIRDFAKAFNCVKLIADDRKLGYDMECSDEDFLIIKIKCPEAIGKIV